MNAILMISLYCVNLKHHAQLSFKLDITLSNRYITQENYFKGNSHVNIRQDKETFGISYYFLAYNLPNLLAVNLPGHGNIYNWWFVDNRVVF